MARWIEDDLDRGIAGAYEPRRRVEMKETMPLKEANPVAYKELPYRENMGNNLNILERNLGNCMQIIDDEVMKGYVTRLDQLPIVAFEHGKGVLPDVQLFKLTELVYQENEFSVHKLATVFHTLANRPCTLVLMIKGNGDRSEFYLGVRSLNAMYSSGRMRDMLERSLIGMFPGSRIEPYRDDTMKKDMELLLKKSISSVTCVADYKQDKQTVNNKAFIQGLDKFVDSMRGKAYTAIFLADSISYEELSTAKIDYENIYTQIAPFANIQINFSTNVGKSSAGGTSYGNTLTATYGETIGNTDTYGTAQTRGDSQTYGSTNTVGTNNSTSEGDTETTGYAKGTNESESHAHMEGKFNSVGLSQSVGASANVGMSLAPMGVGVNTSTGVNASTGVSANKGTTSSYTRSMTSGTSYTRSASNSISKTLTHGINESKTDSSTYATTTSDTTSYGKSLQQSNNSSISQGFNLVDTQTLTDSFGSSQGITLNAQNMMLGSVMKRLESQLVRMEECESIGMWRFAAYFIGESAAETETAANTYHSIISGTQSGIERSAVNTWSDNNMNLSNIADYVTNFCHPRFIYHGFSYDGNREVIVDPSAMVSTNELAIHMGLPRNSVKGLPVVEHAIFAQEVLKRSNDSDDVINIGKVYHLGEETSTIVNLDTKSLAMHTFVTGSTGVGKSNTIYHLLKEIEKRNIPFLIVEPAKGEYKHVFKDVTCYGTNPNIGKIIQINPFSFPKEIHVLEHIDKLIEIFNVCWPMYAAMPAVLKESIEKAYISVGWDIDISINPKLEGLFPTFDDVLCELNNTINSSAYSADTKGDYIGSLSTRIKSLTNGINGKIFVANEMDMSLLFDESAILDISRVGSMETKSLIMGLVVLKLQEYRMAYANEMNADLKHVTVLEEAHHLLKKTSSEQSADSANLQGKSVEMLTNAIAEIRTYGEGFIIVDQAPNLLDAAAIRNTNTKIVMRLPECMDREITGKSIGLNEAQITELSKLPTGVAAVYQNDWHEALLCKMPYDESQVSERRIEVQDYQYRPSKTFYNKILHGLLIKSITGDERQNLINAIFVSNVSSKVKLDLIQNIDSHNLVFEWAVADYIKKNYDYSTVFKGTQNGSWNSLEELAAIMRQNIEVQFSDFSYKEQMKILYYMCRINHEIFPKNTIIEKLRVNYLKKEMM